MLRTELASGFMTEQGMVGEFAELAELGVEITALDRRNDVALR